MSQFELPIPTVNEENKNELLEILRDYSRQDIPRLIFSNPDIKIIPDPNLTNLIFSINTSDINK